MTQGTARSDWSCRKRLSKRPLHALQRDRRVSHECLTETLAKEGRTLNREGGNDSVIVAEATIAAAATVSSATTTIASTTAPVAAASTARTVITAPAP